MMANPYTLIGHITADLTPQGRLLGGTVSYAAAVAQAFGCVVTIHTSAIPDDPLVSEIERCGTVQLIPAAQTTTFENIYHGSERTQYLRGTATMLKLGSITDALVHIAPVAAEIDPLLVLSLPAAATLLITPQGWMRQWDASGRVTFKPFTEEQVLRRANLMVLSRQDIAAAPELEQYYAAYVEHLFVTNGAQGGIYYQRGQPTPYSAVPAPEIDPTGAGDVFAAALLASLPLVEHDMLKALEVARHLAAISVTRRGVHGIITPAEVQKVLMQLGS